MNRDAWIRNTEILDSRKEAFISLKKLFFKFGVLEAFVMSHNNCIVKIHSKCIEINYCQTYWFTACILFIFSSKALGFRPPTVLHIDDNSIGLFHQQETRAASLWIHDIWPRLQLLIAIFQVYILTLLKLTQWHLPNSKQSHCSLNKLSMVKVELYTDLQCIIKTLPQRNAGCLSCLFPFVN